MVNKNNRPKPKKQALAPATQVIQIQTRPVRARRSRRRRRGDAGGGNQIAPVAFSRVIKNPDTRVVTISGSDFIDSATFSKESKPGDVLADLALGPTYWKDTHAAEVAKLYERFKFVKLEMIISARVPTSIAGGYLAGVEQDPDRKLPSDARRSVRALSGSVSAPYWTSTTVRPKLDSTWRYTQRQGNNEERWSSVGSLYLVVDIPPSNSDGNFVVSIEVKYTLQLSSPSVDIERDQFKKHWVIPSMTVDSINDASNPAENGIALKAKDPPLSTFWTQSDYKRIYQIHPAIEPVGSDVAAYFGEQTTQALYVRTMITEKQDYGMVFFSSEALAREAGDDPSRNHQKMIRWRRSSSLSSDSIVSQVTLPAFILTEL